jgi:hypothetical protein
MGLIYKLVGFDPDTEYLALSFDIPGKRFGRRKSSPVSLTTPPLLRTGHFHATRPRQLVSLSAPR